MRIQSAEFERSYTSASDCPADEVPEFAFIGRSNVGKSSLLNLLTGKKGLARVSQTPGCTQLINFFKINRALRFVDLPGYGFAKVPKGGRAFFQQIIADYMTCRERLRLVFVLIDSRLEPQKIDLEFLEWLHEEGRSFALIFTKTDKLKPSQVEKNKNVFLDAISPWCGTLPETFLTSSKSGAGRQEVLGFVSSNLC
jgi:GTP-binding protein